MWYPGEPNGGTRENCLGVDLYGDAAAGGMILAPSLGTISVRDLKYSSDQIHNGNLFCLLHTLTISYHDHIKT